MVKNLFTQTHLTVLNFFLKKDGKGKLFIKIFIKRKNRLGKAYAYRIRLSFKMTVAYNKKINLTQDKFICCEATFFGHNSIFAGHCPMSVANI